MPRLRGDALDRTLRSIRLLEGANTEGGDVFGGRIATTSKVYAAYEPSRFSIYDSRVARALEKHRQLAAGALDLHNQPFPQPAGRAGPGFPGAPMVTSERSGRAGFLRASMLFDAVARQIPVASPDGQPWNITRVEMALFSLGHPSKRKESVAMDDDDGGASKKRRLARHGGDIAKRAVQSDFAKRTLEDQLSTMLLQQFAKAQAMRYSEQTDSLAAQVQFLDGALRWVVFHDETPIAAFPPYDDDLDEALRFHNFARLAMREPSELGQELEEDREARRHRWRFWAKSAGAEQEAVVQGLLELEAGEPEPT